MAIPNLFLFFSNVFLVSHDNIIIFVFFQFLFLFIILWMKSSEFLDLQGRHGCLVLRGADQQSALQLWQVDGKSHLWHVASLQGLRI